MENHLDLPALPPEIWLLIIDTHRTDKFDYGERFDHGHLLLDMKAIRPLSQTCHALRVITEPLMWEYLYLACDGATAIKRSMDVISHLLSHPKKMPWIKYLTLDRWRAAYYTGFLDCYDRMYEFVKLLVHVRGIVLYYMQVTPSLHAHLYTLRKLEALDCHMATFQDGVSEDLEVGGLSLRYLSLYQCGLSSPSLAMTKLVAAPKLEWLSVKDDDILGHIYVHYNPHLTSCFKQLKILSHTEPSPPSLRDFCSFFGFCDRITSLRFDYTALPRLSITYPDVPPDTFPLLESFTGSFKLALVLLPGRPVHTASVTLEDVFPDASSWATLSTTTASLVNLHVNMQWIRTDILHRIAENVPSLTKLSFYLTSMRDMAESPWAWDELRPLRDLQKLEFKGGRATSVPFFTNGGDLNVQRANLDALDDQHPNIRLVEISNGILWFKECGEWTHVAP